MQNTFILALLFTLTAHAQTPDYSRLWRRSNVSTTWKAGLAPQAHFVLGLMDRLGVERLEIENARVYATGDQNLLMQALDVYIPAARTSPHYHPVKNEINLMYYFESAPRVGSAEDYAIALHELCHGLFDTYINRRLAGDNTLSVGQKEDIHRRVAGFNEFFADQCAVYQAGDPRIITKAVAELTNPTLIARMARSFGNMLAARRNETLPLSRIRDSVGPYPDVSAMPELNSHYWFPESRRLLWTQNPAGNLSQRYEVLENLLEIGWRIYQFEAEKPDNDGPRMTHHRYDEWLGTQL